MNTHKELWHQYGTIPQFFNSVVTAYHSWQRLSSGAIIDKGLCTGYIHYSQMPGYSYQSPGCG